LHLRLKYRIHAGLSSVSLARNAPLPRALPLLLPALAPYTHQLGAALSLSLSLPRVLFSFATGPSVNALCTILPVHGDIAFLRFAEKPRLAFPPEVFSRGCCSSEKNSAKRGNKSGREGKKLGKTLPLER